MTCEHELPPIAKGLGKGEGKSHIQIFLKAKYYNNIKCKINICLFKKKCIDVKNK